MYMLDAQNVETAASLLQKEFDKTRNLFVYLVHLVHQIASYAEIEALQRASKNLPNQADLAVNIKLAGNSIVWQTLESEKFKKAIEIIKPQQWIDNDMVKSIFRQLVESPDYQSYILEESREKAKESAILKFIFGELILKSTNAIETIESHFSNWDDDGDMIVGFMLNYFQFIQNGQIQSYVVYGIFFIILIFLGTAFNLIH